jgi:hypothetical protein
MVRGDRRSLRANRKHELEGLNKKPYAEQSADVQCIGYVVWKNVQLPKKNKLALSRFPNVSFESPPRVSAPAVDVAPRHV